MLWARLPAHQTADSWPGGTFAALRQRLKSGVKAARPDPSGPDRQGG